MVNGGSEDSGMNTLTGVIIILSLFGAESVLLWFMFQPGGGFSAFMSFMGAR